MIPSFIPLMNAENCSPTRHQEIFSDQEFRFYLYIQTSKLVLHSYQCNQAFGYVNETITSQSHNTWQDAALQQPWPYPKAWHTLSSTPELVYCTWQSTARLYTIIIAQTVRRSVIKWGFGHFKAHKKGEYSPRNICFVDSRNLWHQRVIGVRVT